MVPKQKLSPAVLGRAEARASHMGATLKDAELLL